MTATAIDARTGEVLAWVRRARGQRRRKIGKAAYAFYVAALVLALYGYPIFDWAQGRLGGTALRADTGPVVVRSLVLALAGLALVVIGAFVRNARWRGPVLVAAADVGWLLPLPLDRGRVLRPRFVLSAVLAAVSGVAVGLLGAAALHQLLPRTGAALLVVLPLVVALVAVLGVSVALLVESSSRLELLAQRWSWVPLTLGALLLALAAVVASRDRGAGGLDDVVSWSGPWGWAAYPVGVAARGRSLGIAAIGGVVALAVVTAVAVVTALRACATIPTQSLRVRARTAQTVGAAMFVGDARQVRLGIRASRSRPGRARSRVRLPRSRHLVVVWRDLTAVLRAPGQLGWAATFAAASVGLVAAGAGASTDGKPPIVVVIVAVLLGYGAASNLVETARIDADAPQVAAMLPMRFSRIAVRHAIVPAIVLAVIGGLAAVGGVLLQPALGWSAVGVTVLCAPPLVGAALFNSYKGRLPIELIVTVGDAGVFLFAGWYLVGPLLAAAALTPVIVRAFDDATKVAAAEMLANAAFALVALTAAALVAVSARAANRIAPPREGGFLELARQQRDAARQPRDDG